jgi:hypothetical protein
MDFLITGYKKVMRVIKAIPEEVMDEVLQDEEYFSLDFLYHICIRKADDFQTIKRSVELLFECRKPLYVNLMECIIGEDADETEEEAYLNRQERLSEAGFPERDVAMSIYTPMSRDEWVGLEKKKEKDVRAQMEGHPAAKDVGSIRPILHGTDRLFVDDALSAAAQGDPAMRDELDTEIMAVSNKTISLAMPAGSDLDEALLKKALLEVKGTLNIALCLLTGTNLEKAAEILRHYWIEHIFRRGFTEIVSLRRRAHALVRRFQPVRMEEFLRFLGTPYEQTLRGLLTLSPSFYDNSGPEGPDRLRAFRVPADLAETEQRLLVIEKILNLLGLFPDIGRLFEADARINIPREDLTMQAILFTAFARFTSSGEFSVRPLGRAELAAFFKEAFVKNENRRNVISSDLKDRFLSSISEALPGHFESVRPFIESSLASAEEELSGLDLSRRPDPRYVRSLCFSLS